jgi:hypothetical protein
LRILLLFLACALPCFATGLPSLADAPGLSLENGWLFLKGDDLAWAKVAPPEAAPMPVGVKWEDAGFANHDGFGWYFRGVSVPESLMSGNLVLDLGKIDDADEVYWNGVKIGATGRMPPSFESKWQSARTYEIPREIIAAENRIAIRVYDGGGGGGLWSGLPRLLTKLQHQEALMARFQPHTSFREIPFSNGLTSAKLNLSKRTIDSFREHIYSQYDEQTRTRDFGGALHVADGMEAPAMTDAAYVAGTGVVRYATRIAGRAVEAWVFAPFTSDKKKLYYLVKLGSGHQGPVRFAARFEISDADAIHGSGSVISQTAPGSEDFITFKAFSDHGAAAAAMRDGVITVTGLDDTAEWVGLSVTYSRGGADSEPESATPRRLLEQELAWWEDWHAKEKRPDFASDAERNLFLQSTAILKMGQCREPGKPYGQILASLPPGHWNICWIRDASYAINGLILANHLDEARAALEFFLKADCGYYKSFVADGVDWGVGVPYKISVCRYYGNGTEESDGGHDPNIELDGFGLFLWVFEKYVSVANDRAFLTRYSDVVFREIADVLVHCMEKDRRIIRPESGPWERHVIDNGYNGVKRFSYTSATAYQGLRSAACLARMLGQETRNEGYTRAAAELKDGFLAHFIHPEGGYIKGLMEENEVEKCLDAGGVEGINFGLVDDATAAKTLDIFDRYLKKPNTPGYARNDDGGDYDVAEWVVIDLRTASAFARIGMKERYETLVNWVTRQSAMNHNIIAELYSVEGADYEGAIPMCGFGPGAYITALFDRPGAWLDRSARRNGSTGISEE